MSKGDKNLPGWQQGFFSVREKKPLFVRLLKAGKQLEGYGDRKPG